MLHNYTFKVLDTESKSFKLPKANAFSRKCQVVFSGRPSPEEPISSLKVSVLLRPLKGTAFFWNRRSFQLRFQVHP